MASSSPVPSPEFSIEIDAKPTETIVRCSGKLTAASTDQVLNAVRPHIASSASVVMDLRDLSYMDSSGLGAMVRLWVASKQAKKKLSFINLNQRLKDLFTLTNLSTVFEGVEHSGM
ncbi:MAG TPA: STAS domain-containing protein [Candidatus Binatia bacterium]|nr:STAS domain-containing protein [Candidatus Binatia bacterium]